jgi:hypothetical protein
MSKSEYREIARKKLKQRNSIETPSLEKRFRKINTIQREMEEELDYSSFEDSKDEESHINKEFNKAEVRKAISYISKKITEFKFIQNDFATWLSSIGKFWKLFDLTNTEQYEVIKMLLDDATQCFIEQNNINDIETLRNKLNELKFYQSESELHKQLSKLKQNGRELPEFIKEVENIYKSFGFVSNRDLVGEYIVRGLDDRELSNKLLLKKIFSSVKIHEEYNKKKQLENWNEKPEKKKNVYLVDKKETDVEALEVNVINKLHKCQICNKEGHIALQCSQLNPNNINWSNQNNSNRNINYPNNYTFRNQMNYQSSRNNFQNPQYLNNRDNKYDHGQALFRNKDANWKSKYHTYNSNNNRNSNNNSTKNEQPIFNTNNANTITIDKDKLLSFILEEPSKKKHRVDNEEVNY